MESRKAIRRKKAGSGKIKLSATQIIALSFAGIIAAGTCLLALPVSSRSGSSCGFLPALFTATSATCVTGLSLFDSWTQWSGFGQAVLLCLIELGGLGFMSAASLVIFVLRKKVDLRQRLLMAQAMSLNEMQSVVRLQKWVLLGSLTVQLTGALVLMLRFLPGYGLRRAAIWGVFHAVSAFCNAGFDLFGAVAPGQSVITFNSDPVICITLMALILMGGLGFFVWEEVATRRRFKEFSVYTKLVLLSTLVLVLGGAAIFLALEWNNPQTLGNMPVWQKVLNAFFQSVTLRTAGFSSVDQGGLTEAGKAVSILWMLVGGASGSTAGGIKMVTVVVLILFVISRARGKSAVNVFRRRIPAEKVMDAMTVTFIVIVIALAGALLICATSQISFLDSLFETVSALATVGVTTGITASVGLPAQLMLVILMYFGRVGVLTISLGFLMGDKAEERFQYAYTNLLIG